MNRKRWLVIIVIVAVAVILAILLDTLLANHLPAITSLEANPEKVIPSGSCQIVCNAIDRDGDQLSYNWSASGGEINGDGANISWTAPHAVGSFNVTVTVTDGRGGEVMDYVIIEVRTNKVPTITSVTADAEWTLPSGSILVTCDASDPDGDELSYEWSASGGVISGTGPEATWNAPEDTGMYDITVVVKDGHGAENTRWVKLSVATGTPPNLEDLIVTANHKYLKENGTGYDYKVGKAREYNIECIVSDASGAVSYNWSCEDGEISGIYGDGSMITWAAPDMTSKVSVTVIVSDVADNRVSKSIVLYVVPCSTCTFG
jgi:hypothetical protein